MTEQQSRKSELGTWGVGDIPTPCVLGHPQGESWSPCLPVKRRSSTSPRTSKAGLVESSVQQSIPEGLVVASPSLTGTQDGVCFLSGTCLHRLPGGSAARMLSLHDVWELETTGTWVKTCGPQWIQLADIFCLACPAVIKLCILKKLITCVSVFNTRKILLENEKF